jgi:hypothetical protein
MVVRTLSKRTLYRGDVMNGIWVSTSYFTCGLIVDRGRVTDAAPIMKWAVGKKTSDVLEWIKKHDGSYEMIR